MAFFVVERSAVDSSLGIPLPEEFPTREAAIAALSAATAAGSIELTGEVFIADLSVAVPVLVMQAAAPVVPASHAAEDQAPEPPAEMDVPAAEEIYSAVDLSGEPSFAAESSLAEA
ncbi:MAG: hypothetical protein U1E29_15850, partial [Coriobacteriia bacterium]|nr:hypothetical protein [Coriobacteriia bacterium]